MNRPPPLQLGAALLSSTSAAALVPGSTSPLLEQGGALADLRISPQHSSSSSSSSNTNSPVHKETRKLLLHLKASLEDLLRQGQIDGSHQSVAKQQLKVDVDDTSSSSEEEPVAARRNGNTTRKKQKASPWALQTFKIAIQIRDLLLMSYKKGWCIIAPSSDILVSQLTAALSQLVVLASTRLLPASPSTPPYGIQTVCIDIATTLHASADLREGKHVLQALLHGINGFSSGLSSRIIGLFTAIMSRPASMPQPLQSKQPTAPIPSIAISSDGDGEAPVPQHSHLPANLVSAYKEIMPMLLDRLFRIVPATSSLPTLRALHQLLDLLVRSKADLYLDALDALASASSFWAKERACTFLSSHWPALMGHTVITAPLAPMTFINDRMMLETKSSSLPAPARTRAHTWTPWWFPDSRMHITHESQSAAPATRNVCRECTKAIDGYGLRCMTGHHDPVHLQCYSGQDGSSLLHYVTNEGKVKLAFPRFSIEQFAPTDTHLVSFLCARRTIQPIEAEAFKARGTRQQAHRCFSCAHVAHGTCIEARRHELRPCVLEDQVSAKEITVTRQQLEESFAAHFTDVARSMTTKSSLSYLDLLLLEEHLSKQLWMLESGLSAGTIMLQEQHEPLSFNLHAWLLQIRALIGKQARPPLVDDYLEVHGEVEPLELLNIDEFLDFITGRMTGLLDLEGGLSDSPTIISVKMQDRQVKELLGLNSDKSTTLLWQLLEATYRFEAAKARAQSPSSNVIVTFPSLHAKSASMLVLLQAISGCLLVSDIRLQERALMLVTRYCRPSRLVSWHALEEILEMLLRWALLESEVTGIGGATLSTARLQSGIESTSKSSGTTFAWSNRHRSSTRSQTDHNALRTAPVTDDSDYRNRLEELYVTDWMTGLCKVDASSFVRSTFERVAKMAKEIEDLRCGSESAQASSAENQDAIAFRMLHSVVRLAGAGLLSDQFEAVLMSWLVETTERQPEDFVSRPSVRPFDALLASLFTPDNAELARRSSRSTLPSFSENVDTLSRSEPWNVVLSTAESSSDGYKRALKWIHLIVAAGASPPIRMISRVQLLGIRWHIDMGTASMLWDTILRGVLQLSSIDRDAVDMLILALQSWLPQVAAACESHDDAQVLIGLDALRRAAAAFLTVSGVHASILVEHELLAAAALQKPKKRTREGDRSVDLPAFSSEPDLDIVAAILKVGSCGVSEVRRVVARFFMVLLAPSSRIVCGPIFDHLGQSLASFTFRCFEVGQHDISDVRSVLLLRMLAGKPTAFHGLVRLVDNLKSWEQRYSSLEAYFSMVTEITILQEDPSLLPALPELCPVICSFVDAVFDEDEHVRTKADILIASLQPKHLERMASCFERKYAVANPDEQMTLCNCALRVLKKLPSWQPITFRLLLFNVTSNSPQDHTDATLTAIALASTLVAAGHPINAVEISTLKVVIAQALGFRESRLEDVNIHSIYYGQWSEPLQSACEVVLPALQLILDAPHLVSPTDTAKPVNDPTATQESQALPTAFSFFDVLLHLIIAAVSARSWPAFAQRSLLDGLLIVTYKLDTRQEAQDLQNLCSAAIHRSTSLLTRSTDLDARLTVLTVMQLFLQRFPKKSITILGPVIYAVCDMLGEVPLHVKLRDKARKFVLKAIDTFPENGLFPLLFKNTSPRATESQKDFFEALGSILADRPELQDHPISDTIKSYFDILQTDMAFKALVSLCHYILRCYNKPLTESIVSDLAQFFSKVVRSVPDWDSPDVQADCLLDVCDYVMVRRPDSLEFLHVSGLIMSKMITSAKVSVPALRRLLGTLQAQFNRNKGGTVAFGALSILPDLLADGLREKQFKPQSIVAVIECYLDQAYAGVGSSSMSSGGVSMTHVALSRDRLQAVASQRQPWLNALANESVKIGYDAAGYLSTPLVMQRFTEDHLSSFLSVGKLFVICASLDPASRQAINFMTQSTSIFAMNILAQATLARPKHASYAQTVWEICEPRLEEIYADCSAGAFDGVLFILDMYTSFRLLLLILRQAFSADQETLFKSEARLANAFMPHCEAMLTMLLDLGNYDMEISPLRATAYNALGDLVNFIGKLSPPTPILLQYGFVLSSLFDTMLSTTGRPASASVQLAKQILEDDDQTLAFETVRGKTPDEMEDELLAVCKTDLMASCKLRHMGAITGTSS